MFDYVKRYLNNQDKNIYFVCVIASNTSLEDVVKYIKNGSLLRIAYLVTNMPMGEDELGSYPIYGSHVVFIKRDEKEIHIVSDWESNPNTKHSILKYKRLNFFIWIFSRKIM